MSTPATIIIKEIQDIYLSDDMPWIVGYSGGKDSTASLQLIWNAISSLAEDQRKKEIHVISTDTLVENPVIAAWVENSLECINQAAMLQNLPFKSHRLTPKLEDRFWVNLIGKGYPAPRNKFRWCTDRLKINTSTKFIQDLSEANGEAILVLGQRKGESQVRDKVMDTYSKSSRARLSKNKDPKLSRVWVYLPVETWSSDDVWEYIITESNPWGVNNQELFDIYREATQDAECPIVVDKSTPSCGDSRFGCYVCTMVSEDKSMQAMIQNDEQKGWMQPILDFRNTHLATDDRHLRDYRKMDGSLMVHNGRLVHGPYLQSHRANILKELLATQKVVRNAGKLTGYPPIELVSIDELDEIRRIWVEQKGELEDLLPRIYEEVFNEPYPGKKLEPIPLDQSDLELLRNVATEVDSEASDELYRLTRTLLAVHFQSQQSYKRAEHLDRLAETLKYFACNSEESAYEFASQLAELKKKTERSQLSTGQEQLSADDEIVD